MTRRGPALWATLLTAGTIIECYALRKKMREHTLSHATRAVFRTDTPTGQVVFTSAWVMFVCWFWNHVLTDPEP